MSKHALLAFGAAASIASAVGTTIVLDHFAAPNTTPAVADGRAQIPSDIVMASIATAALPEAADRFAYVPLDVLPLMMPPPAEEQPPALEPPSMEEPQPADEPPPLKRLEAEIADAWSAETRPERVVRPSEPWHSAVLPRRLPSQASIPRAPLRNYALTKRLAEISPGANKRLIERFEAAKVAWPPTEISMVAVKDEKVVELFARQDGGPWKFVHRYPVLAASGKAGPKLRQGDKQVPEGVYGISFLNPASRYHVSLRVNYPNAFDRQMAAADGRSDLGGDIMIHGKAASIGCLAVGDEAAEELFVLAAHTGLPKITLIIAPTDFRRRGLPTEDAGQPKWLPRLYTEVAMAMSEFKAPPRPPSNSLISFFGN